MQLTEPSAFAPSYVDGGFAIGKPVRGSVLVVHYSTNIESTKSKIVRSGGTISKDIFAFSGGKRFHFIDPDGYELTVWAT